MPIKGVWRVPFKLANGTIRYYYYTSRHGGSRFWQCDGKPIDDKRLPPEFIAAYEEAKQTERGIKPGTFEQAFHDYQKRCPKFARLKLKSSTARIRYLESWLDMPLKASKPARKAPLAVFDDRKIIQYIVTHRDMRWAHSKSAAQEAMIALSAFLNWAKSEGRLDWNRVEGVPSVYSSPIDEARIWEPVERTAFLKEAAWQLDYFYRLEEITGLRLEDAVRLTRSARKREHIIIPTGKSRGQNYAIVPLFPELLTLLDEIEAKRVALAKKWKRPVEPITLLFNSYGSPWTPDGLSTSFYRHRDKVLKGKDRPTIHHLRKNAATNMVIFQHKYDRHDLQARLHVVRNLGEILGVVFRDHHRLDAAAQGCKQLLLQAADRQHLAAQRDLAGHGDIAATGMPVSTRRWPWPWRHRQTDRPSAWRLPARGRGCPSCRKSAA
jgi:hypothetical protein